MNEGKKNQLYDKAEIKLISEQIAGELASGNNSWHVNATQYLLALVAELKDENESLWFMLDEERNSSMNSKHTEMLNDIIENRINYMKLLQSRKGEA